MEKQKIQRLVTCFCAVVRERYVEKLMKDYAAENGYPEVGEAPKYDEQKLKDFDNNLSFFTDMVFDYVELRLMTGKDVCINTDGHDMEQESIPLCAFDKCFEDIVGDYKVILECNNEVGDVNLICKGALVEEHNVMHIDDKENEIGD